MHCNITDFKPEDVKEQGIKSVCEQTFAKMAQLDGFVLSFDIDAVDPAIAMGVDYPPSRLRDDELAAMAGRGREPNGLTAEEAMTIMEYASRAAGLLCLEMVEYNPRIDEDRTTAKLIVELLRKIIA